MAAGCWLLACAASGAWGRERPGNAVSTRYYESARAETMLSSGVLPNMLAESAAGVAAGVHTYYHNASEDPMPHMAAFMLAKQSYWYFFGSTGWWDDSFQWTTLYDQASTCGAARGLAQRVDGADGTVRFSRAFEHCDVQLTCTNNGTSCTGDIATAAYA